MSFPMPFRQPGETRQADRPARTSRLFPAELELASGHVEAVTVVNVSARGVGVRTKGVVPRPGQRVMIRLEQLGKVEATVRWAGKGRFGLELEQEIDPNAFNFASRSWKGVVVDPVRPEDVAAQYRPSRSTYRPALRPFGSSTDKS